MTLPAALPIGFGLVTVTALAAVAARRTALPPSIFLVLVGLGIGFVPGMPRIALRPDLVLTLLLPPLLYSAGVGMSWKGFRAHLRPILLLAVGCVLFTAASVAVVARYLLDLSWAVGFVLGAVVAPPDAVAPMAIAKRFPIPNRVLIILEGEGLVNDATALILFSFAVAAVVEGGQFSPTAALGSFAAIVVGELTWGILIGWGALVLRRMAQEPRVEIVLAMLTPYAAFWVPESLGGSGVLAAVTAGLFVSFNGPRFISPATRLQGFFVWDLIVYLIEGVIFLLTGLQARVIVDSLGEADWVRLGLAAVSVTGAIILVRFAWVFVGTYLPCWLWPNWRKQNPAPPWQETFAIGFTGIRGVVSLAAVLSIPLMSGPAPFPERGLLLLVTFVVILATLVGQGFSFPWVVQKLGLTAMGKREADIAKQREVQARVAGIDAALARLDRLESAGLAPETVEILRRRHGDRRAYFVAACRDLESGEAVAHSMALQLEFLTAEREAIADLYAKGALEDEARRRIERELDLDESRIRHAGESGASRIS
ncbi:MAG: Na+/H+ antiporter [Pseudomonadota bacterium]